MRSRPWEFQKPQEEQVNPELATDLSKLGESQQEIVDLSKTASADRARQRKIDRASEWAAKMHSAFKGISGGRTREGYAFLAIKKFKLREETDDR